MFGMSTRDVLFQGAFFGTHNLFKLKKNGSSRNWDPMIPWLPVCILGLPAETGPYDPLAPSMHLGIADGDVLYLPGLNWAAYKHAGQCIVFVTCQSGFMWQLVKVTRLVGFISNPNLTHFLVVLNLNIVKLVFVRDSFSCQ